MITFAHCGLAASPRKKGVNVVEYVRSTYSTTFTPGSERRWRGFLIGEGNIL